MKKLFLLVLFLSGCIDTDTSNFCRNICQENNGTLVSYVIIPRNKVFCQCAIYIEFPLSEVVPLEETKQ